MEAYLTCKALWENFWQIVKYHVCYMYIDSIILKHSEEYTESVRSFIKNFNKYAAFDKPCSYELIVTDDGNYLF